MPPKKSEPITPANVEEKHITRLTVALTGMKVGSRQWVRHAYRVYRLTHALGVYEGTLAAFTETFVAKATAEMIAINAFNESVQSIPEEEIDA